YHKPLLLTLVNSVNTDEADLQLFFRELERIGRGQISKKIWEATIAELWEELEGQPSFIFEDGRSIEIDKAIFHNLSYKRILNRVYNSTSSGEIEILIRPSNKQQIAFKLKTANRPFALIKIGDISGWLKDKLAGYEIVEGFDDEGYFEGLNEDDSDIRILMGSRSFYEGWDSNRPNIINFINIGVGVDARKFILQAVGRGVRIEPIKNERKRLLPLYNANGVDEGLFNKVKNKVEPLETLVIFGTNRQALKTVISELQTQRKPETQLSLFVNQAAEGHRLLVPVYRESDTALAAKEVVAKFELAPKELNLLKKYTEYISDDRVLLAIHNTTPDRVKLLRDSLYASQDWYRADGKAINNLDILVGRVLDYFGIAPKELKCLKDLDDEIKHFRNIRVSLADLTELQNKLEKVKEYPTRAKELQEQYGKIPVDEYIAKAALLANAETYESSGNKIRIKYVANHYYVPLILSASERIEFIKHIIYTPSEIKFFNDLEDYCQKTKNRFKHFDRWLFSKLDHSLDSVYIPYYNPKVNGISTFNPDFIFWLQKGNDYFIVFIDPKGTEHTDYQHKVDGYRRIFEDGTGRMRILAHDGLNVRVNLSLYTSDANLVAKGYRSYWFDSIDGVLARLLAS
ncbi:restriction endonuclease subunit R, partial [Chloroflexota bacterium]